MVRAEDGKWFVFSSSRLSQISEVQDPEAGKSRKEAVPVIYKTEKDGKDYLFYQPHVSTHSGKVVQLFPIPDAEQKKLEAEVTDSDISHHVAPGYTNIDGKFWREYRCFDLSITKNVLALFIAAALVIWIVLSLVRFYAKHGYKAPRKGMGFFELCVDFIYSGVIKSTLGAKAPKYAPYLLTAFFFILTMNLLGLIVIFPGGANLTGNIAITLVLAVMTFIITTVSGNKHYWKEVFWPDVPIWLKCPLPIMQVIEIFGLFTKPAALCVRLFANMMGGHMIVITLVLLIFIFAAFGAATAGVSVVVSLIFSIFMLALDVLVSFIQAYVFTLLSTIFISMAVEDHKEKHDEVKAA
ncbi:MAG: F0F1 ATP synthase subunit A [Muribaculaceae bacterium]|nr:F0F1 ATP synthase subunit A [Muribaculaceae bacterium]